jgi:hypothetical protein
MRDIGDSRKRHSLVPFSLSLVRREGEWGEWTPNESARERGDVLNIRNDIERGISGVRRGW